MRKVIDKILAILRSTQGVVDHSAVAKLHELAEWRANKVLDEYADALARDVCARTHDGAAP
jgi:hypothetical protein